MKITKIKVPIFLARAIIVLLVSLFFWGTHFSLEGVHVPLIDLYTGGDCSGLIIVALLLDRLPFLFFLLFVLLLISAVIMGALSLVSPLKEKRIKLAKKALKLAINTFLLAVLFYSFILFISHFVVGSWQGCSFYDEPVEICDQESGPCWIAN